MGNNSTENNKDKSENTENINEDNRVDTENNCNTDIKAECKPNNEDDYKIYNYIKEHIGVFLTAISMIVAGISFFINMVSYALKKFELSKWNIDLNELDLPISKNFIYYIIFSLIAFTICIFLNMKVSKLIKEYYILEAQYIYSRTYISKLKAKYKKINKSRNKENKINIKNKIKDTPKGIRKSRFSSLTPFIWAALLNFISIYLIFRMLLNIEQELYYIEIYDTIYLYVIISFIITIFVCYLNRHDICFDKKRLKIDAEITTQEILYGDRDISELESKINSLKFLESKINSLIRYNKKESNKYLISDENIKLSFIILLFYIIVCFVFFPFISVKYLNISQNTFWIYSDTNATYAVVYNESNKYVLKEAEIDGDKLYINLSNQRIIESKDMIMEQMSFDEVIKVDSKKQE